MDGTGETRPKEEEGEEVEAKPLESFVARTVAAWPPTQNQTSFSQSKDELKLITFQKVRSNFTESKSASTTPSEEAKSFVPPNVSAPATLPRRSLMKKPPVPLPRTSTKLSGAKPLREKSSNDEPATPFEIRPSPPSFPTSSPQKLTKSKQTKETQPTTSTSPESPGDETSKPSKKKKAQTKIPQPDVKEATTSGGLKATALRFAKKSAKKETKASEASKKETKASEASKDVKASELSKKDKKTTESTKKETKASESTKKATKPSESPKRELKTSESTKKEAKATKSTKKENTTSETTKKETKTTESSKKEIPTPESPKAPEQSKNYPTQPSSNFAFPLSPLIVSLQEPPKRMSFKNVGLTKNKLKLKLNIPNRPASAKVGKNKSADSVLLYNPNLYVHRTDPTAIRMPPLSASAADHLKQKSAISPEIFSNSSSSPNSAASTTTAKFHTNNANVGSDTYESSQATSPSLSTGSPENEDDNLLFAASDSTSQNDNVFETNKAPRKNASQTNLKFSQHSQHTFNKLARQAKTSASSSASSGSSLSIAMPPITYEGLNNSRFIFDSNTFFDPFFGANEMERFFPDHTLRLAIITWNMNSNAPTNYNQVLKQMLKLNTYEEAVLLGGKDDNKEYKGDGERGLNSNLPEMYVIGLQEAPKSDLVVYNIKAGIQAVLGPNYALLHWASMGALQSAIWLRRELLWSCTIVDVMPVHLRPVATNRIRTKGALNLSFSLFGSTFLFINSHLSAHECNLRARITQIERIQQALKMSNNNESTSVQLERKAFTEQKKMAEMKAKRQHQMLKRVFSLKKKVGHQNECLFWLGDLNFRLEMPIDTVLKNLRSIIAAKGDSKKELEYQKNLMKSDQLTNLMNRGLVLEGFEEAIWPPPFIPTYKTRINQSDMIQDETFQFGVDSPIRLSPMYDFTAKLFNGAGNADGQQNNSESSTSSDHSADQSNAPKASKSPKKVKVKTKHIREELIHTYNCESGRVPSYTDRILFQQKVNSDKPDETKISCTHYDAINDITSSDHKPVYAMFEVKLEAGGPSKPTGFKVSNNDLFLKPKSLAMFTSKFGRKARITQKMQQNEYVSNLINNPMSASLSSLSNAGQTLTNDVSMNFGKVTTLNAGAFERQVYLDGLRMRNKMLMCVGNNRFYTMHQTHGIQKSHSLDSEINDPAKVASAVEDEAPATPAIPRLPISPLVASTDTQQDNHPDGGHQREDDDDRQPSSNNSNESSATIITRKPSSNVCSIN